MGKSKLELKSRRKIYEVVKEYPGLHMRAIKRKTGQDLNLVKYHLRHLKNDGLVSEMEKEGYKRYFPERPSDKKIDYQDKKKLAILRNEKPLGIVLYILKNDDVSHGNLLEDFDMAASTLSYHLKKLVNSNILTKEGRTYDINDRDHIAWLITEFKPTEDVVEGFIEMWEEFSL